MKKIEPAHRVSQIEEYWFSRKLKEVAALNAEGKDIVSLGVGGPDRMPPTEAIDAMIESAAKKGSHSYQPFSGLPALRTGYADWYRRIYNVDLDPNREIQPLIGSKEGIINVDLTFLNPDDGVLVPNPGYPTYTSAARLVEARVISYDLLPEKGWQPDFEALEKMDLTGVKLMWVNYPNMPTGGRASLGLFEKLIDFGRRHNIVIAHDNPYSFILNDKPLSILQVPGAKDIAVELNSLSKSHNMAGWRMGMLASNPEFVNWFVKVKSNVDSGQFRPMMEGAIEALKQGDEWHRSLNEEYQERRKIAEQIMNKLGCTWDKAQRGLFLWGKIPETEESAEKMTDRILHKNRVFVVPGFIFGSNGERYLRISLCATQERLKEALSRI